MSLPRRRVGRGSLLLRPEFLDNQHRDPEIRERFVFLCAEGSGGDPHNELSESEQESLWAWRSHTPRHGHSYHRPLLRSLWPDGGIRAHERKQACTRQSMKFTASGGAARPSRVGFSRGVSRWTGPSRDMVLCRPGSTSHPGTVVLRQLRKVFIFRKIFFATFIDCSLTYVRNALSFRSRCGPIRFSSQRCTALESV